MAEKLCVRCRSFPRRSPRARICERCGKAAHACHLEQKAARLKGWDRIKREVLARDGPRCHWCGKAVRRTHRGEFTTEHMEFDHVVPFIKGGAHDASNVVVSCRTCNRSRGSLRGVA